MASAPPPPLPQTGQPSAAPHRAPPAPLVIGGESVLPGETRVIALSAARLYDFTDLSIPVHVTRGRKAGPVMFLTAAVHGDEINGVEIVRRVLARKALRKLRGTLIAVPVVNVFGFNNQSRNLPDGRDLNRSFPGSPTGSLTARMASLVVDEIVSKCTHGIDLHTGTRHRANLPQIRACVDDPETERLARAFGVPVIINAALRDGSLRETARAYGIPVLLFEGGEALRFDEHAITLGVKGVLRVMRSIGMLEPKAPRGRDRQAIIAKGSHWVRAPHSGILRATLDLGARVARGDRLGILGDPLGTHSTDVRALHSGIVIGAARLPLTSQGDALFHVATFDDLDRVEDLVGESSDEREALLDGD
jgi:predicted deacylase